jgi:alkylation response protein AidB-like acyl-CoA dehydrogenase
MVPISACTERAVPVNVVEVLAGRSGTLASIYMVNAVLGGALIALMGTPSQKATLLAGLRAGRLQLAFAMTERRPGPTPPASPRRPSAAATDFTLKGEKIYTTGASTADQLLVVARLAEQAQDKRAFTIFLVPGTAEGLTIEPLEQLSNMGHASCRVQFDDVPVDADAVLGGPSAIGSAWATLRITGALERLTVSAMALGLATAIVERAIEFAKSRKQFGQPIAKFQAIQHMLVEMRTHETTMRLFVDNALNALESSGHAGAEIPMAKYVCSEQLQTIAALGMRVMGGRAFFRFEEMERYYREAPFSLFAGGTVEIQKMLIARAMGLP